MFLHPSSLLLAFSLLSTAAAQTYVLNDTYIGHDFFDSWNWESNGDPTHGRVNYLDQPTAMQYNLSWADSTKFVMSADSTNLVPSSSRGRDSVRVVSNAAYDDYVMVLDLQHMPEGCSTWPAFWTLSKAGPWPHGGEFDIIEGVNLQSQNLASLHTAPNCTLAPPLSQKGSVVSTNCDVAVNYNQGCGSSFSTSTSYGSAFNANAGGWYVAQKSATSGINVWFWRRSDPGVPHAVSNPQSSSSTITPSQSWGLPEATFPSYSCDYPSHFDAHQIVFDLTFCGDWAGTVFGSSGCGSSSCNDFVDNNPSAFRDAFWEINSLRVYTATSQTLNVPIHI